jgi:recombinational DNA repair protein RecR
MTTIEYKITFELLSNRQEGCTPLSTRMGDLLERSVSSALCNLIDQGKTWEKTEGEFTDEERDKALAIVKKFIGKFDLEATEVSK